MAKFNLKLRIGLGEERENRITLDGFAKILKHTNQFLTVSAVSQSKVDRVVDFDFSFETSSTLKKGSILIDIFVWCSENPETVIIGIKYLETVIKKHFSLGGDRILAPKNSQLAVMNRERRILKIVDISPTEHEILKNPSTEKTISNLCNTVCDLKIESVEIIDDEDQELLSINSKQARKYSRQRRGFDRSPSNTAGLHENIEGLVTKANFDQKQKWRFEVLGRGKVFYAKIIDEEFWERVHNQQESFYENQPVIFDYYESDEGNVIVKIQTTNRLFD